MLLCVIYNNGIIAFASDDTTLNILDGLNDDELSSLLSNLSANALEIFGGKSFVEILTSIANGDIGLDYTSIFSYILSLLGTSVDGLLWLFITIISIGILFSLINGIKSDMSSVTVSKTIHIASMIAILTIVATTTYTLIESSRNIIDAMNAQMSVLFPIIFTIMSAVGSSTSVAVYQPTMVIISNGIMECISYFVIPAIIFAFVFITVGSLGDELKLTKMSDFILSTIKWVMGTAFFSMCAFMSVQGITASVFDSISIRTAKLTLSKYLPVIGGYLSEAVNLVLSGSVVVKNALGYCSIILLILTILPIVVQLIVYSLTLKLSSAVLQPLGNDKMSKYLEKVSGLINVMIAVVLGCAFIYFVFILLIVVTGNISI